VLDVYYLIHAGGQTHWWRNPEGGLSLAGDQDYELFVKLNFLARQNPAGEITAETFDREYRLERLVDIKLDFDRARPLARRIVNTGLPAVDDWIDELREAEEPPRRYPNPSPRWAYFAIRSAGFEPCIVVKDEADKPRWSVDDHTAQVKLAYLAHACLEYGEDALPSRELSVGIFDGGWKLERYTGPVTDFRQVAFELKPEAALRIRPTGETIVDEWIRTQQAGRWPKPSQ
jgi:hypothetical protein